MIPEPPPKASERAEGPLAAPGVLWRLAPFAVVAVVGQVVAAQQAGAEAWAVWVGWALDLVTGALILLMPWRRLAPAWQAAPVVVFVLAIVFLRHGSGGDDSPVTALLLLPILWATLHGTSRQAGWSVAAAGAALLAPIVIWGTPAYRAHVGESVVYLALGTVTAFTGRQLIRSLHASEEGFRLVTETATDVVARVDVEGRFKYVSPSARAVLGYAPEELLGRPTADLAHPDDVDTVRMAQEALYSGRVSTVDAEWRVRLRDGGYVWMDTNVRAVRGPDGELLETHLSGRDVTQRHEAEAERDRLLAELGRQALEDPLTRLFNRRGWEQRLKAEWGRMQRTSRPLTIVVLDLDHFKTYNDRYGHPAGDELLRRTAEAWRAELRPYDLLARLGGDEFGLALPDSTPGDAVALVGRLRSRVEEGVGCSAGIVDARSAASLEVALLLADDALYAAKAAGRDRSVVSDGD